MKKLRKVLCLLIVLTMLLPGGGLALAADVSEDKAPEETAEESVLEKETQTGEIPEEEHSEEERPEENKSSGQTTDEDNETSAGEIDLTSVGETDDGPAAGPSTTIVVEIDEATLEEPVVNAIVTQPADFRALVGEHAAFSVETTGEVSRCQWQYSKGGRYWHEFSTFYYGGTSELSMRVSRGDNDLLVRCVVYFANGQSITSENARLTVVSGCFEEEPKDVIVAPGEAAEFSVVVKGTVSKYEWQYLAPDANRWKTLNGKENRGAAVIVASSADDDGTQYRCVVTLRDGTRLTSGAAVLNVVEPVVIVYPSMDFDESVDGATVGISVPGGVLPEGTTVTVKPAVMADVKKSVSGSSFAGQQVLLALDISFHYEGKEIQPDGYVDVTISSDALTGKDDLTVVHIGDDGAVEGVKIPAPGESVPDGQADMLKRGTPTNTVTFSARNFSVYAVLDPGETGEDARLKVIYKKTNY